jgi:asparagine synthase (glutamine-hydrolysing)
VGAFLSGGIDSATIVGTMAELGARPKTFSIGWEEQYFDELTYARQVARRFGTDHHELVVRPDAWALAEQLAWFLDEPFADVSVVPTYLVAGLAAAHVKVVLSGDGGDEVFAGYDRYALALREARRFGWLPSPARLGLAALSSLLPESAPGKHYLRHLSLPPSLGYIDGQSLFPAPLKARLLAPDLMRTLHDAAAQLNDASAQSNDAVAQFYDAHAQLNDGSAPADDPVAARLRLLDEAPGGDRLKRLQYLDTMTYLPLDILTKVDRMTMAHSLEARPPLCDHVLVERVFSLPSPLKLDGRAAKAVLKRAVADLLPPAILRRPKRGFGVPIRHWFRGPLREPVEALLTDRRAAERGWVSPAVVRALLDEHQRGRRDQSLRLWALMMLELWCRRFLDERVPAAARAPELAHA